MSIRIALAGNPNSGKTTLFNALTGSTQYVGNWPGVTVEKKEGRLKNHKNVTVVDLPGIYSLSPYTLEEVVARNYLVDERPDVILNIIDGTNLERNLYLSTQLTELGIPVVIAINMMDVVQKNGDVIHAQKLAQKLACQVVEISALKGTGVMEAAQAAIEAVEKDTVIPQHSFSGSVEHALAHIEEALLHDLPEEKQRWFAIKLFERDEKIAQKLQLSPEQLSHIENDIQLCENEMDDDCESIITSERYKYIDSIIGQCCRYKRKGGQTLSDKIDRIVTNRILALPIFALVMTLVFYVSVTTVGTYATDWANEGLFGDGWHLLGMGSSAYAATSEQYEMDQLRIESFLAEAQQQGIETAAAQAALEEGLTEDPGLLAFQNAAEQQNLTATASIENDYGIVEETFPVTAADFTAAVQTAEPDPADFGVWVPGIPVIIQSGLEALGTADWLQSLILDGIVAGVGGVLGFVPQILILFIFLAFLEGTGYMARVAFIMDRIFRKFGLSGKSFIPMLIGLGCGVPGIMASRTIENDRDRRMTIMTTTFIPCSAKLPIIALISGALFQGAWWVAPSAYFVGIAAIICSGIILKKTSVFSGDVAPFVMELPTYHLPTPRYILSSMWERGFSFIKKAGTVILLSTIFIWFTSSFGFGDGGFGMVDMQDSILAAVGNSIAWIFAPLGFGDWRSAVATVTGLVAKENVVGTFGVLFGFEEVAENGREMWSVLAANFTVVSAYAFLVFNLLCAPCFAAMGAIRREMQSPKWFWIAVGYQTGFAYAVALVVYQLSSFVVYGSFSLGTAAGLLVLAVLVWLLVRRPRQKDANQILSRKGASA